MGRHTDGTCSRNTDKDRLNTQCFDEALPKDQAEDGSLNGLDELFCLHREVMQAEQIRVGASRAILRHGYTYV